MYLLPQLYFGVVYFCAIRNNIHVLAQIVFKPKIYEPNTELLKQKLLQKGVNPTPKIIHALRKKQIQKFLRKSKKLSQSKDSPVVDEESAVFETIKTEYRAVSDHLELKGRPWERRKSADLMGVGGNIEGFSGEKLKGEYLDELREALEERNGENLRWVLDDDVEEVDVNVEDRGIMLRGNLSEDEKILLLVKRLTAANLSTQDWKFSRVMKQSGIIFSEMHLLKIIERLGILGKWRLAISLVEWVYNQKDYKHCKSRFVYTKLLSVLGNARRPIEACQIFSLMRDDGKLYPDMAAYRTISVTLGQAGLVNELISIIECMRQKPSRRVKNMKHRDWDPCLEPDVVIFNAVLNACVPSHQWKGVSWVLQQMRTGGLKPTETTYGLAMEVEKLKRLPHSKPLEVTFTGMILSSLDGGYPRDCISIYEYMKDHCIPNIGTINAMLKVYGCSDMFAEAKELFQSVKDRSSDSSTYFDEGSSLKPDAYSYTSMLEASASARQWEYFEHVYREMTLFGFQPDQDKHTRLLVAASRAGKWHLLEHALDRILEAGEVPRVSLFIEIICQTISQQNFERTVNLINGMAHASMRVGESQWSSIFSRNKDRLDNAKLQNLLNYLENSINLVMEDPAPSFLRSVKAFGQLPKNNALLLAPPGGDLEEDPVFRECAKGGKHREMIEVRLPNGILANESYRLRHRGAAVTSASSGWNGNLSTSESVGVHLEESVDFDVVSGSVTGNTGKQLNSIREQYSDSSVDEPYLDLLDSRIESSFSKLPSASDILDAWKKDRIKDGIFI